MGERRGSSKEASSRRPGGGLWRAVAVWTCLAVGCFVFGMMVLAPMLNSVRAAREAAPVAAPPPASSPSPPSAALRQEDSRPPVEPGIAISPEAPAPSPPAVRQDLRRDSFEPPAAPQSERASPREEPPLQTPQRLDGSSSLDGSSRPNRDSPPVRDLSVQQGERIE